MVRFFPDGSILVANSRCQNLKDFLVCGDPCNIKHDLTDIVPHQCKPYGEKFESCDNFVASQSYVISNTATRKYYIIRESSCSAPHVVYMAYCKNCKMQMQGVGSTISCKPRLRNYKNHIKKNVCSCKIATHFFDECCDEELLSSI